MTKKTKIILLVVCLVVIYLFFGVLNLSLSVSMHKQGYPINPETPEDYARMWYVPLEAVILCPALCAAFVYLRRNTDPGKKLLRGILGFLIAWAGIAAVFVPGVWLFCLRGFGG